MQGTIIVGAGRGLAFARWITERDDFDVDVKALVDNNPATHGRIRTVLDRYGWTETRICSTLSEALAQFDAEAAPSVMVVASNAAHAALTREALAANRHVFLEKPIAASPEDAAEIERVAATAGDRIVMLGFVLRYSPYFIRMHEIAASGRLGRIVMLQANERLDHAHSSAYRRGWRRHAAATGGFLNEKCSHDVDLLCWMKAHEAKPSAVFSFAGKELFPPKADGAERCTECAETCPFRQDLAKLQQQEFTTPVLELENRCTFKTDADVFNHQSLLIRFDDGAQAVFTATAYSGDPDRDFMIHGTEGFLAGSLNEGTFEIVEYRSGKRETFDYGLRNNQHGGADFPLLLDFFMRTRTGTKPECTASDGALASRICFAADRSAATGRQIDVNDATRRVSD